MSSLFRRLGWCLLAYIGLAWLPWVLSGYHTHVLYNRLVQRLRVGVVVREPLGD